MKQSFQKMKLVPFETVNPQPIISPKERQLSKLDMDVQSVLKQNIPNDQKLKLYRRALNDYIFMHNKVFSNQSVQIKNPTVNDTTDSSSFEHVSPEEYLHQQVNQDNFDDSSIIPIPENDMPYRTSTPIPNQPDDSEKAIDDIVKHVNQHPEILKWDEGTQEIIYKGKNIPNSNIIDLLSNIIYLPQQQNRSPHGAQIFNRALQEIENLNKPFSYEQKAKQLKKRKSIIKSPYSRPVVKKPSNDEMNNLILQALQRPQMVKNRKRKIDDTAISEPLAKAN